MEAQTNGLFISSEDQQAFDNYSKEQIYEAYLAEYQARKKLNAELNSVRRKMAEVRHLVRGT